MTDLSQVKPYIYYGTLIKVQYNYISLFSVLVLFILYNFHRLFLSMLNM